MSVTFTELHQEQAWRDQAACHPSRRPEGMSRAEWTSVFFPPRGGNRMLRRALEMCEVCPVRSECFDYGLGLTGDREGIWGGTTGRRRRRQDNAGRPRKSRYSDATKAEVLRQIALGELQVDIHRRTGIAVQTIRRWRSEAA